jgi:hypothetical protein
MKAFEQNVGTGRFRATRSANAIHIIPIATRNDKGEWVSQQSALETPLSLSEEAATSRAAIEILSSALSDRLGTFKVVSGTIPDLKQPLSLQYRNQPVRLSLDSLVSSMGSSLSWQLFFDISERRYLINVGRTDRLDMSTCF